MALFLQSANALASKVAQWVGAIPSTTGISAIAYDSATGTLTVSTDPQTAISVGDFICSSITGQYTLVIAMTNTTIIVSDPEVIWSYQTYPVTILKMPSASSVEIQACIQFCELKMRVIELPSLRTDPYSTTNPSILVTDAQGMAPIPADMNWPILFFQDTAPSNQPPGSTGLGPWIVYDRVGDREIIRRRMIDQLYVRPFGVPRVIRASFSEVGPQYVFTPNPGEGVTIKAYYQRTFPFLLTPTGDNLDPVVQSNAALASFPEGYLYGTLWAYYDKNKNTEEAQKWDARFNEAYGNIEDQNFKDKWRGGDQHLTSEFQPRNYRYSFK